MAGIASVPERKAELEQVIASLAPQVDEIRLSLNGYTEEPLFLRRFPNVVATIRDGAGGDAEKFADVDDWDGIVVTCDDDLLYPDDYVHTLVSGLDRHGHDRIVGFHGGLTDGWREHPHGAANVKRIACLGELRHDDTDVNVLGTGVMAYDARHTPLWRSLFRSANMADVYLACHAHRFGIPMVALAHEAGWLGNLEPAGGATIYESNRVGDGTCRDTRDRRRAELDRIDWTTAPTRPLLRVSIATCQRPELLGELLLDLEREAQTLDVEVAVYEDPTDADYGLHRDLCAERGWTWTTMADRCGKDGYWMLVDRQHRDAAKSSAEWFVFLPDDVRLVHSAFARAIDTWLRLDAPAALTLWRLMDHEDTGSWTGQLPVDRGEAFESFFVDGNLLCRRELLDFFHFALQRPRIPRPRRIRAGEADGQPAGAVTSSGVGRSMSLELFRAGKRMYRVSKSLAVPVPDVESVMNPEVTDRRYPGVAL